MICLPLQRTSLSKDPGDHRGQGQVNADEDDHLIENQTDQLSVDCRLSSGGDHDDEDGDKSQLVLDHEVKQEDEAHFSM